MILVVSVLIVLLGEAKSYRPIYEKWDKRPICPCSLNTVDDPANTTFPYKGYVLVGPPAWAAQCGATLITDRHLLVSAHCMGYATYDRISLPTIKLNLEIEEENALFYNRIKKVVYEPGYAIESQAYFNDYDYHYDIAIAELSRPVPWIRGIRAAVLPSPELKLNHGTRVSECGWGMLDDITYLSEANSTSCLEMSVVGNGRCERSLNTSVDYDMLCAGAVEERWTCMKDTGGGLLVRLGNDSVLCGLKSFGRFRHSTVGAYCHGDQDMPVGYTKLSKYVEWIYAMTMSSDCKPCIYNRPG